MSKLMILNYHAILPDDADDDGDIYKIRLSQFVEQLDCIEKSNIPIVLISNWKESIDAKNLFIALTFDDGLNSHFDLVLPELLRRNITAAFFPIVSQIGERGYLSWSQLIFMQQNGFEIGSHSYSHKRLVSLTNSDYGLEIIKSNAILQKKLGQRVTQFSFPYGVYSQSSILQLSSEYKTLLSTSSRINLVNSGAILHRFNIKNNLKISDFERMLNENYKILQNKKISSMLALSFNRIRGWFVSFLTKKARSC